MSGIPCNVLYLSKAAIRPGTAAEFGEIEKDETCKRRHSSRWSFLPTHCGNLRTLVAFKSRDSDNHRLKSFINEPSNIVPSLLKLHGAIVCETWQYNAKLLYNRLNLDFDDCGIFL